MSNKILKTLANKNDDMRILTEATIKKDIINYISSWLLERLDKIKITESNLNGSSSLKVLAGEKLIFEVNCHNCLKLSGNNRTYAQNDIDNIYKYVKSVHLLNSVEAEKIKVGEILKDFLKIK